jgi:coenzyme F420 hydrogenase subunit delta
LQNDIPEFYQKRTLVLGVGNILFGDDGFGPEAIHFLEENYQIPDDVAILDVGTGARGILFTIALAETKPERIIVIDACDCSQKPGEVFIVPVEKIPGKKIDDFSMHQLPTSNLLRELQDLANIEVIILAAQPESIPEMVSPGLSIKLRQAMPEIGEYLAKTVQFVPIRKVS